MKRIMFVCHGNICRSPMAELVFKKMLAEKGVGGEYSVCSRATSAEELGNPVYPPARAELARHGIDTHGKYAVQLRADDYEKYDLFVGMDSANIRNMVRLFEGDPAGKVRKLLSYAGEDGDVADPWYTGNFSLTYTDVVRGCEALLEQLLREKG